MVKGLPNFKEPELVCENRMAGKKHMEPIPKHSTWRVSKRLELIHAHICRPISSISKGNKRYFITFLDHFSRKTWIYFLTEKSAAFETFKKFKVMIEKEAECEIGCLGTDRGGEFTSKEFDSFCEEKGIKRHLTAAYTPQHNVVAETKNRTILNMVRSMLSSKNVLKTFLPEAVNWVVCLLNRCPTFPVKDATLEEAWCKEKHSVRQLRVFGCLTHVHFSDSHRKKLDDKSMKCVFLGVSEEYKAYRFYEPNTKRIITRIDVVFSESEAHGIMEIQIRAMVIL